MVMSEEENENTNWSTSPAMPEHPATSDARAFYCPPRIVLLRFELAKRPWQERQLGAGAFSCEVTARRGCSPPIPEPPRRPHLTSARPAWWSWVLPRVQPPARRSGSARWRQLEQEDAACKTCVPRTSVLAGRDAANSKFVFLDREITCRRHLPPWTTPTSALHHLLRRFF